MNFYKNYQQGVCAVKALDFIAPLFIRLFLAPVFIIAGFSKLQLGNTDLTWLERLSANPNIVAWFGNEEWGLGLPFAELLANLAAWTEFLGGWLLMLGLLTRLVSIPLLFTMFVAATTVHWDNGWFAIAPSNPETSPAKVLSWLGSDSAQQSLEASEQTSIRLERMRGILDEHGNTNWLYENGAIVVLNNGIEFAATYFIMLLVLLFSGGGRYVSFDYYLARWYAAKDKPLSGFA
jgi:uncharacterized membrane protein YphA (DoxX/SURF4 family)